MQPIADGEKASGTKKCKEKCENACRIAEKVIILQPKSSKNDKMKRLSAYFYGYYFYCADTCEA